MCLVCLLTAVTAARLFIFITAMQSAGAIHLPDLTPAWNLGCRFFEAGACELRIGVYESFDTLCIYLESDALASPERNFWVKYRIAVVNQRHPDRTEWKDSAICTKTWNNSVLQFMKVA